MSLYYLSVLKNFRDVLCLILLFFSGAIIADEKMKEFSPEKMKEFSSLFSPPLDATKTAAFFLFGVDDSQKLEDVFNRMSEENYTDSININEDILLEFLLDESEGKKLGLSAKKHKEQRINASTVRRLEYKDGRVYVGETKNNTPHGKGTYTTPSGHKYVGEFDNGVRSGKGTMTFPNGNEYVGDWKNEKPNGKGTMTYNSVSNSYEYGSKYIGEWKDYAKTGRGTQTWRNGDKYVGDWKDNKRHGKGIFTWGFGTSISYEGDWKDGKRNGNGTYIWRSGAKYVGGWKDDKKHGAGILTSANGNVTEDTWINGHTQEFLDARNKKRFKPYAVCLGASYEPQINIMMNLFQSNNNPAAVTYMLDVGCSNSWSRPIRGRDLVEFSRNGKFIGVKTKVHMTGVGKIYAIIFADEWDSY